MKINDKKSELIIYLSEQNKQVKMVKYQSIQINGEKIYSKASVKYLGIMLDMHLRWTNQIVEMKKKLASTMSAIYRIRNVANEQTKKTIYYAIKENRIAFAIEAWGTASNSKIQRIQKSQNKIIRILHNKDKRENVEELMKEKGYLTIKALTWIKLAKKGWEILSKETGEPTLTLIKAEDEGRTKESRKYRIKAVKTKTNWGERKGSNKMITIFNWLQSEVKLLEEVKMKRTYPKGRIKKLLLQKQSTKDFKKQ